MGISLVFSIERRGAVPWQIDSSQLTSGSPLSDLINQDLSVHGYLPILHCRNVNSVMKDEMAFSIPTAKKPVSLYTVHDGAVHTVQRSPFYKDIILTVGGWNVAIWKEGIMVSCLQNGGVGVWSFIIEKNNRNNRLFWHNNAFGTLFRNIGTDGLGPSLSAEPIQAFGKHNCLLFFPEGRKHLQVFCSLKPMLSSKLYVVSCSLGLCFSLPLKIQDGVLITVWSPKRSNGSIIVAPAPGNLSPESGSRKFKGSITRQRHAEVRMRQCQESGGQGQGLDPDSQKLNCQNLERLVKLSEAGVWENQYDISLSWAI